MPWVGAAAESGDQGVIKVSGREALSPRPFLEIAESSESRTHPAQHSTLDSCDLTHSDHSRTEAGPEDQICRRCSEHLLPAT
jgi:hypothetical protein